MDGQTWALLLVLAVLWGASFFFFKILAAEFPPFTVVLGRVGLAALMLDLLLIARGGRNRTPIAATLRYWRGFLLLGLLNNVVPFSLIVLGETRISSGLAAILNATTPIFTIVAAQFLASGERLTRSKGLAILLGLAGVITLVGPGLLYRAAHGDVVGQAACLAAAMSYALAGLYGRRFVSLPPLHVAAGQLNASTLILVPLALAIDRPWALDAPSAQAWAAWIAIALFCTALAYVIYFRILAAAGATNLLLVTFLLPVTALLPGATVLGETITPRSLVGMAIIGLALAVIDGRAWAAVVRRRRVPRPIDYEI